MNTVVTSNITGKTYDIKRCVRILNMQQVGFYLSKNAEVLDLYPSRDYMTGKPLVVFLFDREKTKDLYSEWCDNKQQQ